MYFIGSVLYPHPPRLHLNRPVFLKTYALFFFPQPGQLAVYKTTREEKKLVGFVSWGAPGTIKSLTKERNEIWKKDWFVNMQPSFGDYEKQKTLQKGYTIGIYPGKTAKKMQIKTNRMEVSSEFFTEIKRNRLRYMEVPIKAIYTKYSMEKGQSSWNAFKILFKLILRRIMS